MQPNHWKSQTNSEFISCIFPPPKKIPIIITDRETGYGRAVTPHPGPVGDRSDVTQVCAQAGLGPVWRRLGRPVEQHDAGCHQNAQIG